MRETEIRDRIVTMVATALEVGADRVDVDAELASLGLSSIQAFTLTGDLAEWLEQELPTTLMWEHPTIRRLAAHLAACGAEVGGS